MPGDGHETRQRPLRAPNRKGPKGRGRFRNEVPERLSGCLGLAERVACVSGGGLLGAPNVDEGNPSASTQGASKQDT